MLAVRRRYVVALGVAAVFAVVLVVVPKVSSAIHDRNAAAALVAADAAFKHLKVPADYEPIPKTNRSLVTNLGCSWFPCYRVRRSGRSVRLQLPAILRSTGARSSDSPSKTCPAAGPIPVCMVEGISHGYLVRIFADPILRPGRKRVRTIGTVVQITAPYVITDDGPSTSPSDWPVK